MAWEHKPCCQTSRWKEAKLQATLNRKIKDWGHTHKKRKKYIYSNLENGGNHSWTGLIRYHSSPSISNKTRKEKKRTPKVLFSPTSRYNYNQGKVWLLTSTYRHHHHHHRWHPDVWTLSTLKIESRTLWEVIKMTFSNGFSNSYFKSRKGYFNLYG